MVELEKEKERLKTLEEELEVLKEEEKLEEEIKVKKKEVEEILERLHPAKRGRAYEAIKKVLGGIEKEAEVAYKEIRGTPEERAKRRAAIVKRLKEFAEYEKKRKEEIEKGEIYPTPPPTPVKPIPTPPIAREPTALDIYAAELEEFKAKARAKGEVM
jgi:hypothetical protein